MLLQIYAVSCKIETDNREEFMPRIRLKEVGLSNREVEVAEEVAKGLSNKEVASLLFVTEKTIKFHLTNIYKKLEVKSRAKLIVWCAAGMNFVEQAPKAPEPTPELLPITSTYLPTGNKGGTGEVIG